MSLDLTLAPNSLSRTASTSPATACAVSAFLTLSSMSPPNPARNRAGLRLQGISATIASHVGSAMNLRENLNRDVVQLYRVAHERIYSPPIPANPQRKATARMFNLLWSIAHGLLCNRLRPTEPTSHASGASPSISLSPFPELPGEPISELVFPRTAANVVALHDLTTERSDRFASEPCGQDGVIRVTFHLHLQTSPSSESYSLEDRENLVLFGDPTTTLNRSLTIAPLAAD